MSENRINIEFVKMTGAGNDFVLIDNRSERYSMEWSKVAPVLCNRRYGIGADGLLVVEKKAEEHYRMKYFNADGSYGGMCGNGGRCFARFLMDQSETESVEFEALDHIYTARRDPRGISLKMIEPKNIKLDLHLKVFDEEICGHYVNTGTDHVVVFLKKLPARLQERMEREGIVGIGKAIRNHVRFAPGGTNVNFIEPQEDGSLSMRTYEKGVEDETLACGTGAVASTIVASMITGIQSPVRVLTRGGELLHVSFEREGGRYSNVELRGSAKAVFIGSFALPEMACEV